MREILQEGGGVDRMAHLFPDLRERFGAGPWGEFILLLWEVTKGGYRGHSNRPALWASSGACPSEGKGDTDFNDLGDARHCFRNTSPPHGWSHQSLDQKVQAGGPGTTGYTQGGFLGCLFV